jgi:Na+/glutamate symporter
MTTVGVALSEIFPIALACIIGGLCAGGLFGMFIAAFCARRGRESLQEEYEQELRLAMQSRDSWEKEAKRLRASLDGASSYTAKFPRPLTRG